MAQNSNVFADHNANQWKFNKATGAASGTSVTVANIATDDILLAVLAMTVSGGEIVLADKTSEFSIDSAGNIKNSTTALSNHQLLVIWLDRSAAAT